MQLVPGHNLLDLVRPRLGRLTTLRGQVRNLLTDLKEMWRSYRGLPDKVDALLAQKPQRFPLMPIMGALLLIAALQLDPGDARTVAVALAAALTVIGLLRSGLDGHARGSSKIVAVVRTLGGRCREVRHNRRRPHLAGVVQWQNISFPS